MANDLRTALERILEEPKNTMSDGKALKAIIRIAKDALAQPAPVQAGAQQAVADDECQLVGVKSDGTEHVLGTVSMPPKMKARDIVRSYFGYWDDDDECCDAAMAMMCCEELIAFMQKPVRVDLAAPTQAGAGDAKGGA